MGLYKVKKIQKQYSYDNEHWYNYGEPYYKEGTELYGVYSCECEGNNLLLKTIKVNNGEVVYQAYNEECLISEAYADITKISSSIEEFILEIGSGAVNVGGLMGYKVLNIKEIVFDDGVMKIDDETFYFDDKNKFTLNDLSFPDSLVWIGKRAFKGINQCNSIMFGDGVRFIDKEAFDGVSYHHSGSLPSSIRVLNNNCFNGFTFEDNMVIFEKDSNLVKLNKISSDATELNFTMMMEKPPLIVEEDDGRSGYVGNILYVPLEYLPNYIHLVKNFKGGIRYIEENEIDWKTVPFFSAKVSDDDGFYYYVYNDVDDYFYSKNDIRLWNSSSRLELIEVSDKIKTVKNGIMEYGRIVSLNKVETIGDYAFECYALGYPADVYLRLPETVKYLGYEIVKYDCGSVRTVYFEGKTPPIGYSIEYDRYIDITQSIPNTVVDFTWRWRNLQVPCDAVETYKEAYSSYGGNIIGYGCPLIEKWEEDGTTMCEGTAKYNVERKYVSDTNGYLWSETDEIRRGKMLYECAYECGCDKYKLLAYNEKGELVKNINCDGDDTLSSQRMSDSITSVYVGECVSTMSVDCFYYSRGIREAYIADTVKTIGNYPFNNCASLRSITIGKGIEEIGEGLFWNNDVADGELKLTIYAEEPPKINENYTFSYGRYNKYDIRVPEASICKYKCHPSWLHIKDRISTIESGEKVECNCDDYPTPVFTLFADDGTETVINFNDERLVEQNFSSSLDDEFKDKIVGIHFMATTIAEGVGLYNGLIKGFRNLTSVTFSEDVDVLYGIGFILDNENLTKLTIPSWIDARRILHQVNSTTDTWPYIVEIDIQGNGLGTVQILRADKLEKLILRSPGVWNLTYYASLPFPPKCIFYVNDDYYDEYIKNSNWRNIRDRIRKVSELPND